MGKNFFILVVLIFTLLALILTSNFGSRLIGTVINKTTPDRTDDNLSENQGGLTSDLNPLAIASLRAGNYPGSDIIVEETLEPGSNYDRMLTSYKSEGLKIYALLTIPKGDIPKDGWPAIIFNHGYIPPNEYRTTEKYIAYVDGFARNGYIVFRPDYRGHGSSEGEAPGGYGSNAYTIDVLNATSSLKRYNNQISSQRKIVDIDRIGMWGHSMGGFITLRNMVTTPDIKAGVIWAGVVASYPDLINNWRRSNGPTSTPSITNSTRRWRQLLVEQFGEPSNSSSFWQSISANFFLKDISGPLQIHHGTSDTSVPVVFSRDLEKQMKKEGKEVELFVYEGDDHNISANFNVAMQRSIEFFDKNLKK